MTPRIESARRAYAQHALLIRRAIVFYIRQTAAARGYELSRQDMADRVEDAVARSWITWQKQRDAVPLPNEGSLDERIAARDRRVAFRAARSAAKRVSGRRVPPLGSERPHGYTDALDGRAKPERMEHFVPEYVQQLACDDTADTGENPLWEIIPDRLRTTAIALSMGITVDQCAAVQGVSDGTIRNHKRELRTVLGLANLERGLRAGC